MRSLEEQQQIKLWKSFFYFTDIGYRFFCGDEEGTGLSSFT